MKKVIRFIFAWITLLPFLLFFILVISIDWLSSDDFNFKDTLNYDDDDYFSVWLLRGWFKWAALKR